MELHIEQGHILEEEGISIGIVTAIAAPASIKQIWKAMQALSWCQIGILEPHPGAIGSIPSKSHLEIGMLLLVNNVL